MSQPRSLLTVPLPLMLGSAALLVATLGSAHAAPVISVTIDTQGANNTSILPATTAISTNTYTEEYSSGFNSVTTPRSVVITPAGPGVTGLAWDYIDTTYSYITTKTDYKYDAGTAHIDTDASQPVIYNNGKYIEFTGTIHSSVTTTISYNLYSNGHYIATTTPFGEAAPALPAFYFSLDGASLAAQGSYMSSSAGNFYGDSYSASLALTAGSSVAFHALVYAGDNVALSDFGLNLSTSFYASSKTVTPHSSTTSQLVGAHLIPALAVPEPSTYLMLMGGLLLIGNAARRRSSPTFH